VAAGTRRTVVKTENELQIDGEDKPVLVTQTLAKPAA
jgi:hypothetical protein